MSANNVMQKKLIRAQEAELREVVDTIPAVIVWSALPDGSNSYVSRRFAEYGGVRPEQLVGIGWHTVALTPTIWIGTTPSGARALRVASRLRTKCVSAARMANIVGTWLKRTLRDQAGSILKWYGVITDIEDRKRADDKVRAQEMELQQVLDYTPLAASRCHRAWGKTHFLPIEPC